MSDKSLEQKRRVKRPAGRLGVELDREEGLRHMNDALVRACGKRASRRVDGVEASTARRRRFDNKFKFSEDAESARSFALTKSAFQPSGSDWSSTA